MSIYVTIIKDTLEFFPMYYADGVAPLPAEENHVVIPLPSHVSFANPRYETLVSFYDSVQDQWTLVEDPVKLQEYIDKRMKVIRSTRNEKLSQSDWTMHVDVPMTAEQKSAWMQYRQALRDFPSQVADVDDLVWPPLPSA